MEIWKPITGYEGLYSVSNLGNIKSLERVVPHGKSGTRMYGKRHSEKARQKIGDAHKGLKHSEATRQKMGESHRGRKFSDDHKKALSQSLKIAKSGYRWVTDGTVSRHVPPEIASVLLSSGWRRGMAKKKHSQA